MELMWEKEQIRIRIVEILEQFNLASTIEPQNIDENIILNLQSQFPEKQAEIAELLDMSIKFMKLSKIKEEFPAYQEEQDICPALQTYCRLREIFQNLEMELNKLQLGERESLS